MYFKNTVGWRPPQNMSIYLMLILALGMVFLPLLQLEVAEAQPEEAPDGWFWKEVQRTFVIGGITTIVVAWVLERIKRKTCSRCSDDVPSEKHQTYHAPCSTTFWTCPTQSQGAQHQLQACSNGHPYYSCSSQSVKDYHTKAKTCSNVHIYFDCSSEATKNYHTREEVGSCPDGHTYYRCKASDFSRHNKSVICSYGHSYYRCHSTASKHRAGLCVSSGSSEPG